MSKHFELVVYTAGEKSYADRIINFIENKRKFFAHRLYKAQCVKMPKGRMYKNLQILCANRGMQDIIIVDNCVNSFSLSVRNGVPIKAFKGEEDDRELVYLSSYLKELSKEEDIRDRITKDFAGYIVTHRYVM